MKRDLQRDLEILRGFEAVGTKTGYYEIAEHAIHGAIKAEAEVKRLRLALWHIKEYANNSGENEIADMAEKALTGRTEQCKP